jgi:uncharacterized protein YndB with AHSA1/START domain
MTDTQELTPVRKRVTVEATKERAFSVFTEGLGTWWPLETHHIGTVDAATVVIEPFVGGRCYERGVDGTECDWARVAVFEPPNRLVILWQLSADWAYDATMASEVEVRFVEEGPHTTLVELEHRGLETYGDRAAEIRTSIDSEGGWSALLAAYAASAVT